MSGFFYFQKKSACGGLLLFYFSPKTKFGIVFGQISRFCLKNTLKNFRLRRAGGSGSYYFPKNFSLRRAFIIFIFSKCSCSYYFLEILQKFPLALIILLLRGVLIINTPVSCSAKFFLHVKNFVLQSFFGGKKNFAVQSFCASKFTCMQVNCAKFLRVFREEVWPRTLQAPKGGHGLR